MEKFSNINYDFTEVYINFKELEPDISSNKLNNLVELDFIAEDLTKDDKLINNLISIGCINTIKDSCFNNLYLP